MKSPSVRACPGRGRDRRSKWLVVGAAMVVASVSESAFAAPSVKVKNVTLAAHDKGSAEVSIQTDKKPTFSARIADEGKRIIVDVEDAKVEGAPPAILEGNELVSGVMTQSFDSSSSTRVMIQLAHPAAYRIRVLDGGLEVSLATADKTVAMQTPRVPSQADGPLAPKSVEEASVTDVRYDHAADRDRVFIVLDADATFKESATKDAHRIEITHAHVPEALERTLDVGAFHGVIQSISTFQKKSDGSAVIDIGCIDGAGANVTREGDTLVVTVIEKGASSSNVTALMPSSMDTGKAADGGVARRVRTISHEDPPDLPKISTSFSESSVEPEQADAFMPGMAMQPKVGTGDDTSKTQGRRINLDLKDADIHDVLRLLADVGKVNVVVADNVSGSVTIRMQNVPWDQALDTILQAKGLGMVRKGNLIRVALQSDLNKERELALAKRKSEFELAPIETRLVPISYASAKEMQERAKDLLSPRGSVAVDDRTNVLIVRDVTGNLNQIEELVRALDTQTPQVLIEARIVEASSTFSREVGIQWGGDATFSQATGNDTGIAFPNSIGLAGGASDGQDADGGALADHIEHLEPELRREPACRDRSRKRRRARSHLRFRRRQLQLERPPFGTRSDGHGPHHLEPTRPDARQQDGAHQLGHPDSVLSGRRARRTDRLPGSEAATPRHAARDRRRKHLDAGSREP